MLQELRFNTEDLDHVLWKFCIMNVVKEKTVGKGKMTLLGFEGQMIQRRPERNLEGNSEEAHI